MKNIIDESMKQWSEGLALTYEEMKDYTPRQIAKIIKEDMQERLLCICGGPFDDKRTQRCEIAIRMAIKMLEKE